MRQNGPCRHITKIVLHRSILIGKNINKLRLTNHHNLIFKNLPAQTAYGAVIEKKFFEMIKNGMPTCLLDVCRRNRTRLKPACTKRPSLIIKHKIIYRFDQRGQKSERHFALGNLNIRKRKKIRSPNHQLLLFWCKREESNLHPFRDWILSPARLPFRHSCLMENLLSTRNTIKNNKKEVYRRPQKKPLWKKRFCGLLKMRFLSAALMILWNNFSRK